MQLHSLLNENVTLIVTHRFSNNFMELMRGASNACIDTFNFSVFVYGDANIPVFYILLEIFLYMFWHRQHIKIHIILLDNK